MNKTGTKKIIFEGFIIGTLTYVYDQFLHYVCGLGKSRYVLAPLLGGIIGKLISDRAWKMLNR